MKGKNEFFLNGLLMTLVAFLMRTVAVSFNVYLSNRAGAEAMGLLSLVGGVYGFAVTLATSGIHIATVRTVATELEKSRGESTGKALPACLSYAFFFGTLSFLLLFLLSKPVGVGVLKDPRAVKAMRMLSFTLLPTALSSVLNGYFNAVRRAFKNALVQVSEQGFKIFFTVLLLTNLFSDDVEKSVFCILLGGAVAEGLSLLLNLSLFFFDRKKFFCKSASKEALPVAVFSMAFPVAVSTYARSILLTIEHILIPKGLLRFGMSKSEALASYGVLHGMALPVVLYPAALLCSFASLLIPEITREHAAKNGVELRYITKRVYQMTLLFSIGTAAVMLFLSEELGSVLYHSKEVARYIRLLSPLIPIMYLDTATDAILKGMGEQVYSMNVNILDALISVVAVVTLLPLFGIDGYLMTVYITEIVNATLSVCRMLRVTAFRPRFHTLVLRPLLSALGAVAFANLLLSLLPAPSVGPLLIAVHVLMVTGFYFILLYFTGTFDKADAKWLLFCIFQKKQIFRFRYSTQKNE